MKMREKRKKERGKECDTKYNKTLNIYTSGNKRLNISSTVYERIIYFLAKLYINFIKKIIFFDLTIKL